jgi:hypothetical protein
MDTSTNTLRFADACKRSQTRPLFETLPKSARGGTLWVTRARPKIDRIACPWLILRFIDPHAEFLYVPAASVHQTAREQGATPFDVPDTRFSHREDRCSFDAFVEDFELTNETGLEFLARIIRGADTGRLDIAPEAAGLLAVSLGLSRLFEDDLEMLQRGLTIYDCLYSWARDGRLEDHGWNAATLRTTMERS